MHRRRRHRTRGLLAAAGFVALWWLLLAPPALGGRTSYITVSGKSMEPTYRTGDLVVVREAGSYDAGDIVAFRASGGIVIHRIIGGDGRSGYTLQGDNNSWIDPWTPTDADVVGAAQLRLPGVARWLLTLLHPAVLASLVAAAVTARLLRNRTTTEAPRSTGTSSKGTRSMQLDDLRRTWGAISRRTRTAAVALAVLALVLATVGTLAWFDDTERTTFREDARVEQSAELTYLVHMDRTTLFPDGTVGPVDASTPETVPLFAKPAQSIDLTVDYRLGGAAAVDGRVRVDAVVSSDAGWSTTVPLAAEAPFDPTDATLDVTLDLRSTAALIERVADETGTAGRGFQVSVQSTFVTTAAAPAGSTATERTFVAPFDLTFDGATWQVTTPLQVQEVDRIGSEVTEQVRLAGVPVEWLRLAVAAALGALLLAIALVALAVRRSPAASMEAVLRRPGIDVIDLERPPADDELAVSLANAVGIRRVAERDGGLVLRYEDHGTTTLYARHDSRIYRFDVEHQDS